MTAPSTSWRTWHVLDPLNEQQQVNIYTAGLLEPLKTGVEL
jgi:hypothetical protein